MVHGQIGRQMFCGQRCTYNHVQSGQVAQVVERSPEKAGVGGSTPSLATIILKRLASSSVFSPARRYAVFQCAWSLADHFLLIEADDRSLRKGGLEAGIYQRISLRVLAWFARASCYRNSQGPVGIIEGILGAIGDVSIRLLEAWKVSPIPHEGGVHP